MRVFVDRIEEGMATLLLGDEESITVHLPVAWLPAGVCAGMVLRLDFHIDPAATAAQRARIRSLMESMGNEP